MNFGKKVKVTGSGVRRRTEEIELGFGDKSLVKKIFCDFQNGCSSAREDGGVNLFIEERVL